MKKSSFLKDILQTILVAIAISYVLLKFIIMPCIVTGTSMEPTLKDGQIGYSFIFKRNIGLNRFDICIIDPEIDTGDKLLVKRIVGLPNEIVEYKDNCLYINGEYMQESFLTSDVITEDFYVKLEDDEYFCLGDNRYYSRDSRYYGAFSKDEIVSSKFFVLYPFDQFGVKK